MIALSGQPTANCRTSTGTARHKVPLANNFHAAVVTSQTRIHEMVPLKLGAELNIMSLCFKSLSDVTLEAMEIDDLDSAESIIGFDVRQTRCSRNLPSAACSRRHDTAMESSGSCAETPKKAHLLRTPMRHGGSSRVSAALRRDLDLEELLAGKARAAEGSRETSEGTPPSGRTWDSPYSCQRHRGWY